MKKLHTSIGINTQKEKVWHAMLDDATYRQWTAVFAPDSHYVGSWEKGSKILFLAPEGNDTTGMVSRIAENKPYEFISIEHLGILKDGKEDTTSEAARKWAPAYENYTFKERDGATEVIVDMDIDDEHEDLFNKLWPEALKKLKDLAENE